MDTEYVDHLAGRRRRDPTARLFFTRARACGVGVLSPLWSFFLLDRLGLSAPAGTAPCSRGAPRRGARRTACRRGDPRSTRSDSDARSPSARLAFRSPVPLPLRSWLIRRLLGRPCEILAGFRPRPDLLVV